MATPVMGCSSSKSFTRESDLLPEFGTRPTMRSWGDTLGSSSFKQEALMMSLLANLLDSLQNFVALESALPWIPLDFLKSPALKLRLSLLLSSRVGRLEPR